MPRNIELKARCANLELAAERAAQIGARDADLLVQIDTYFAVSTGRLKLRTINYERAELIHYHRDDRREIRESNYQIVPIQLPSVLGAVLEASIGVRIVVRKRRRLMLWENVRIHLDEVAELGSFLEFEAVVGPEADEQLSADRVARLKRQLQIDDADLIECSYSDLLLSQKR